ncbi:MAG: glycosyltransferase [candidate division WOR-3 bacterium]
MGVFLRKKIKNILFVTVGYTFGGTEKMIARISPILRDRGYEIKVLAFKGWGPMVEELKKEKIKCISLFGKGKFDLRVLWRYFFYLLEFRPDLVIAFLYRAYIPTRIFCFLLGIPNISSVQGVPGRVSLIQKVIERITAPLSCGLYSCSNAVTEFLIKVIGIRKEFITTINNGVDIKFFSRKINREKKIKELGLNPDSKVVGTISRLEEPTKGIKILLEAFRVVQEKINSQLLIVGSGKDEFWLKEMAKDLKIKAIFLGERSDVPEILQVMDVFVLSSFYEGLPIAILEAMASQLPIVTTSAGSCGEVVLDGKTGFVVEPGNPSELAKRIEMLLKDDKKRRKFGEEGFKRVRENFTIDKTVSGIEGLWKKHLGSSLLF